jgi:hypothetical protein
MFNAILNIKVFPRDFFLFGIFFLPFSLGGRLGAVTVVGGGSVDGQGG